MNSLSSAPKKIHELWLLLKNGSSNSSEARYRSIVLVTLSSWIAKGVSISVNLVSVPLAANYLGLERYGLWLTASSVIGWLAVSDLGVAKQLTTLLARTSSNDDRDLARLYTTSALWILIIISLSVGVVSIFAWRIVPWDRAFGVTSALAQTEALEISGLLIIFTVGALPLSLFNRIYYAYQEGWKANLLKIASSIISLAVLLIAVKHRTGLPGLAIALAGIPVFVQLMGILYLFGVDMPWLLGSPALVDIKIIKNVMSGSLWMFLLNLQSIFWLGKDNLLIAQLIGPESVGPFNAAFRIYTLLLGIIIGQVGESLWPTYTEASERGDMKWVQKTFKRSMLITMVVFGLCAIVFAMFADPIITLWAGKDLVPPTGVPWLLGIEFLLLVWVNNMGYLLMALENQWVAAISGIIGGLFSVLLIAIPSNGSKDLAAIPIANAVAIFICMVCPLYIVSVRSMSADNYIE